MMSTYLRVIALWELGNKHMSIGRFACLLNLHVCGIWFSIQNVFLDGRREKCRLLVHKPNLSSKPLELQHLYVCSIQQHFT